MKQGQFIINTDIGDAHVLSRVEELLVSIDRLKTEKSSFLYLESNPVVKNVNYMQAVCNNGLFYIEIQVQKDSESFIQYGLETTNIEELIHIFTSFVQHQQVPDFSKWSDVTSEIFG